MADTPDIDSVIPAAAGIELLRGYYRLREDLLCHYENTSSPPADRTAAILSGDYASTAAYSTLAEADGDRLEACFEELTIVLRSIIEGLDPAGRQSAAPANTIASVVEETVGALGKGAAIIGATLAGGDDYCGDRYAMLGQGLATARQVRLAIAPDAPTVPCGLVRSDETTLRRHAERRLNDVNTALRDLSSLADVDSLRTFGTRTVPGYSAEGDSG